LNGGLPIEIAGNNLEFNTGRFDLYNNNLGGSGSDVIAQQNWWGRTDLIEIKQRIFDWDSDDTKGRVIIDPVLPTPGENAPAYVRGATLTPQSPVWLQPVVMEVQFSRPMDRVAPPQIGFRTTRSTEWEMYNLEGCGVPSMYGIRDVAIDTQGFVWFSTQEGVCSRSPTGEWIGYGTAGWGIAADGEGGVWWAADTAAMHVDASRQISVHDTYNSPLPAEGLMSIFVDAHGNVWFATRSGAYRLSRSGEWTSFNTGNSGIANDLLQTVYVDGRDRVWFNFNTTDTGVSMLAPDGTWSEFNSSNSGLPGSMCGHSLMDSSENMWFACVGGGIARLSGDGAWSTYRTGSPPLLTERAIDLALDYEGTVWVATAGAAYKISPAGNWSIDGPPYPGMTINAIATAQSGDVWFGFDLGGGAGVLHRGVGYTVVDDATWASDSRYFAAFDFSTLVPRGTYSLTVSAARGSDGIEIAPYSGVTFTVDYAGSITDETPPHRPSVMAWGNGTVNTLSARWTTADPESTITLYRYAIGTTPGGAEVVNWTDTPGASLTRGGLTLVPGQPYYVAVKARNAAGLWSEPGVSAGVIDGAGLRFGYMPLVLRGK
jgi:hypothetical protein